MDKQLIIHVGLRKTGTTYMEKAIYKPNGYKVVNGATKVADMLGADIITCNGWAGSVWTGHNSWYGWLSGTKVGRLVENVAMIDDMFNNPKIIISTRDLRSLIISHYKQHLHTGGILTLDEYLDGIDRHTLMYDTHFDSIIRLLGSDRFFTYDHQRIIDDLPALVNDLSKFTGLNFTVLNNTPANVGVASILQVNGLRLVNRIMPHKNSLFYKIMSYFRFTPRDVFQYRLKNIDKRPYDFSAVDKYLKNKGI